MARQPAVKAFSAPTQIVTGLHGSTRLGEQLSRLAPGAIAACVVDEAVLQSGALDEALSSLGASSVLCAVPGADPSPADVEAIMQRIDGHGCAAVVMAGGGSAIGAGKAVALRLTNRGHIEDYLGLDKAAHAPAPSVAIPTTAGSGSEVSSVIVLHDHDTERIVVLRGAGYEPDIAILDGALVAGLPDRPLLNAAFDALSHAMEALWAKQATAFTAVLATGAVREILAALPAVIAERRDSDLQRLLEASTMANLACGPSGLALVHALATSSGAIRLPHGYQTGILLPHVAAYNLSALPSSTRQLLEDVSDLYTALNFPTRFAAGEVSAAQAHTAARAALGSDFHANNVRGATLPDLLAILRDAGADTSDISGISHAAAAGSFADEADCER